jgi:hypothetical protein
VTYPLISRQQQFLARQPRLAAHLGPNHGNDVADAVDQRLKLSVHPAGAFGGQPYSRLFSGRQGVAWLEGQDHGIQALSLKIPGGRCEPRFCGQVGPPGQCSPEVIVLDELELAAVHQAP